MSDARILADLDGIIGGDVFHWTPAERREVHAALGLTVDHIDSSSEEKWSIDGQALLVPHTYGKGAL